MYVRVVLIPDRAAAIELKINVTAKESSRSNKINNFTFLFHLNLMKLEEELKEATAFLSENKNLNQGNDQNSDLNAVTQCCPVHCTHMRQSAASCSVLRAKQQDQAPQQHPAVTNIHRKRQLYKATGNTSQSVIILTALNNCVPATAEFQVVQQS